MASLWHWASSKAYYLLILCLLIERCDSISERTYLWILLIECCIFLSDWDLHLTGLGFQICYLPAQLNVDLFLWYQSIVKVSRSLFVCFTCICENSYTKVITNYKREKLVCGFWINHVHVGVINPRLSSCSLWNLNTPLKVWMILLQFSINESRLFFKRSVDRHFLRSFESSRFVLGWYFVYFDLYFWS